MHISFTTKPKTETRLILDLSAEEAAALYWAIDPSNDHMRRWIAPGHLPAFFDMAQDIEGEIHARLVETGNDPDQFATHTPNDFVQEAFNA